MNSRRHVSRAAGLLATAAAVLLAAHPARAETENCRDMREKILAMEANSIRPPGWYKLDSHLRRFYDSKCGRLRRPAAEREKEWWYFSNGTRTAVAADRPPPALKPNTARRAGSMCNCALCVLVHSSAA